MGELSKVQCALAGVAMGVGVGLLLSRNGLRRERGAAVKAEEAPVKESTIRLMTRVAMAEGAVNLSQGFPNEPPPPAMVCAAAGALLAGESEATARAMAETLLKEHVSSKKDSLNQYSFPYGAPCLRKAISAYYGRWYPTVKADAEANVTVVMGATEGFACSMRALTSPGDVVVFFQPFHELYPSQVAIFHLKPRAVTLTAGETRWSFDEKALDAALDGASLFLFNDPHNPTGHCFTDAEKITVARLCKKHGVVIVTDEIYEHMHLDSNAHVSMATMHGDTVIVNSISKTAKATGWRVGWVVADAQRTKKIRAVHDQLVACCPTPLQFGVAALLGDPKVDVDLLKIASEYREKRDLLVGALRSVGFEVGPVPRGAYYVFAQYANVPALRGMSPTEAAMHMTRVVKVACVPGDNFYLDSAEEDSQKYLRFAFVRSVDLLKEARDNLQAKLL